MAFLKKPVHECWICGSEVSLEECKIDEHGQAVHEDCYLVALAFHHPTILRYKILCDNWFRIMEGSESYRRGESLSLSIFHPDIPRQRHPPVPHACELPFRTRAPCPSPSCITSASIAANRLMAQTVRASSLVGETVPGVAAIFAPSISVGKALFYAGTRGLQAETITRLQLFWGGRPSQAAVQSGEWNYVEFARIWL